MKNPTVKAEAIGAYGDCQRLSWAETERGSLNGINIINHVTKKDK